MLRTMGALATVLALLAGALWVVRRYNIRLPGAVAPGASRRLMLVERIGVDARRSVALIRRDGCEHLILLTPEGNMMIETGIVRPPEEIEAEKAEAAVAAATPTQDFAAMVERFSGVRSKAAQALTDAAVAAKALKQRVEVRLNMIDPPAPPAPAPKRKRAPARRPTAPRKPRARKASTNG